MSDTAVSSENKMGTMPVNKLLITMSLPMIASMLVQALYNIVDSIFVAQIGENALTAVSLAFPIQSLMIAVAVGTCVGINALLSRCLGEKRQNDANLTAINGVFISFASYLIFAVIGLLGTGAFFRSQTSNPEVIKYGTEYLSI
ncbi:MAG: MATE family efflux transporter, partial [Clostridium sp.]